MERDNRLTGNKRMHDYNQMGGAVQHHRAEMQARIKELKSSLNDVDSDLKNRIKVTLAQWVSLIQARNQMVKDDKKLAKILHSKLPSIVRGKEPMGKAYAQISKFVQSKKSIDETNGASTIKSTMENTFALLRTHKTTFAKSKKDWTTFYRSAAAIAHNLHKLEKEVHRERKKISKTINNKQGEI